MRVIPVDARVAKVDAIFEMPTRRDGALCDVGRAVESVVEADAVPVNGRRLVEAVLELDDQRCPARRADQRTWILAIEAIHDERFSRN